MKISIITNFLIAMLLLSCKYEENFPAASVKDGTAIELLPKFKLLSIDSTHIKSTDIPNNKVSIFVFFDPTCHNCKDELRNLRDSLNFFVTANFVLLAPFPLTDIKQSPEIRKFVGIKNVTIASDFQNVTQKVFNCTQVPMTVMYDKQHRLRAVFRGAAGIQEIITQYNKIVKKPTMEN